MLLNVGIISFVCLNIQNCFGFCVNGDSSGSEAAVAHHSLQLSHFVDRRHRSRSGDRRTFTRGLDGGPNRLVLRSRSRASLAVPLQQQVLHRPLSLRPVPWRTLRPNTARTRNQAPNKPHQSTLPSQGSRARIHPEVTQFAEDLSIRLLPQVSWTEKPNQFGM